MNPNLRIVAAEWAKVRGYRNFWTILGVYLAVSFLTVSVVSRVTSGFEVNGKQFALAEMMQAPRAWDLLAWIGTWSQYMLGLLVILLVSNEWEFRTARQGIIDGLSRNQWLTGRFYVVVSLSLLHLAVTAALGAVFATPGAGGDLFEGAGVLGLGLLATTGYLAFATLAALYFRRAAPTIIAFLAYGLIGEPLLGYFLDLAVNDGISSYLPLNVLSGLVAAPWADSVARFTGEAAAIVNPLPAAGVVFGIVAVWWMVIQLRDL